MTLWNLEKIYSPEEQRERALKALRLNGDVSPDYEPRLLAASSFTTTIKKKPTVRITKKRSSSSGPSSSPSLGSGIKKLKDASSIQGIRLKEAPSIQGQLLKEREKAEKALKLNGLV